MAIFDKYGVQHSQGSGGPDIIYVGAGIALYTNLLACIGYLWLGTNAHLLARQEV